MPRTLIAIGMTLTLASVGVHVQGAAAQAPDTGSTRPVAELPVSLERIQRRIDEIARAGDDAILLRLTSYVDVFARAPGIELFRPTFDLELGPIPYGAPTHGEMIAAMTPRLWRPPPRATDGVVGLTMRSLNSRASALGIPTERPRGLGAKPRLRLERPMMERHRDEHVPLA